MTDQRKIIVSLEVFTCSADFVAPATEDTGQCELMAMHLSIMASWHFSTPLLFSPVLSHLLYSVWHFSIESTCVRSTTKEWDPFVHFVRKLRSMFDREEVVWPHLFTWWKHFFVCSLFIDRGQKPFQFVRRGKEAIKLSSLLRRTMHWSAGIWIFIKGNCNYKYKYKYKYKENKVSPLCPETWEAVRVQTRKRTLVNTQSNIFQATSKHSSDRRNCPGLSHPRVSSFMDNILNRTQYLFLFVPQEKNITVKLARLQ